MLDGIEAYMTTRGDVPAPAEPIVHVTTDSYPRDEAVKRARQHRRELEKKLREAQKAEREAITRAREREAKEAEKRKK